MLPVNYCPGFTSLKLYGHVKFPISIMRELCSQHYFRTILLAVLNLTSILLNHVL